ncbi:hypothetical protein PGTUg99_022514 [Puccinia graminis f. sp. tritici]|uniref:Uncharacterized protein n=1 Tax=Puccinia graminis f. sp. tritici TaxID=56615 RepID=A0A5B0MQ41_PUCGR|nr:hypothetical protein PGTUg99_022514 [Puccinia graminis f. sp. tritici]
MRRVTIMGIAWYELIIESVVQGALKAITVHDAISDLPEFEYLNPDRIMAEYRSRRPTELGRTMTIRN